MRWPLLFAFWCVPAGCNPSAGRSHVHVDSGTRMLVIGHRGAAGYAPEHTFASYDLALEQGVDYLEQDLQMTADGVLVVLHDDTLQRTTQGVCSGAVIERTLAELRACNVGSWYNAAYPSLARPEYADQRIPTLEEVLLRYRDRSSFYIETKNPDAAPGMEEALVELLDRYDLRESAAAEWRVVIQSFSERSLRRIHELDPTLPLIQLIRSRWSTARSIEARLPEIATYAVGVGPPWRHADAALVEAARALCLEVHPYTVNDPVRMARLADLGVTGMFTDVPDQLIALRPSVEPRGLDAVRAAAGRYRACRDAQDRQDLFESSTTPM